MKKLMVLAALLLFATSAFCQEVQNGIIYIKHPYIDVVNNAVSAYTSGDFSTLRSAYADTGRFWSPAMNKWVSFDSTVSGWKNDMNYFTDLKMPPIGYPDYLQ